MVIKDFLEVLKKYNIPEDVKILSDSGWECGATDIEAIYYNKEKNFIVLVQSSNAMPRYHIGEYLIYANKKIIDDDFTFVPEYNSIMTFVPNDELYGFSNWEEIGYAVLDENNQVVVKPLEEK